MTRNRWLDEGRVSNIAHAGGLREAPQNTLYACRTAASRGADVIEIDVHVTRDGHVVALHDSTVDATTDGAGCVVAMTLDELRELDAAHHFVPGEGTVAGLPAERYPYRGVATGEVPPPDGFDARDFRVPTLAEIFQALPDATFNIEMKPTEDIYGGDCVAVLESIPPAERPDLPRALAEVVTAHAMADQLLVATFIEDMMAAFTSHAPGVDTAFTFDEGLGLYAAYRADAPPPNPMGHMVVQASPRTTVGDTTIDITAEIPAIVTHAHDHGIAVHVWTVNDPTEMAELVACGVDGIITDVPSVLRGVLEARGAANHPA